MERVDFRSATRVLPARELGLWLACGAMTPGGHDLDLSKIWLFSTSSAKDLRTIRRALEEVAVPPGRVLCEQGTIGREFFLIVKGEAAVSGTTARWPRWARASTSGSWPCWTAGPARPP